MTIALIGLILIQSFWLHLEYKVKEDLFNQQVTQVFLSVNKELDAKETIIEVSNEIFSLRNKKSIQMPAVSLYKNTVQNTKTQNQGLSIRKDLMSINDSNTIHTNTRVQILKGDSVLFTKILSKCKPENYCKALTNIDVNKEISNRLTDKTLFVEKIINKMLNYNDDITKRLNFATLQTIIQKQMENHQIYLQYEFAVKNDSGTVIYKTPNFQSNYYDSYKTQLFPNDIFSPAYYLVLFFPKKDNFIAYSMGAMSIVTLILILVIIFSYTLTLYIILRQKKLSEMKNDFINNMTHELKTPISTISLASQMLNDNSLCKDGKNVINVSQIIAEESKRLAFQVEKVLQMAIFDRGEYRFNKQELSVNSLIANITATFSLHVSKRNGTLNVVCQAADDTVIADELHLSNTIINLLENALKYSGDKPEIEIKTFNINHSIVISIKDNGIGISKQDLKHVFEKFYRVHTGNIHNVKGFGLGLSYAKIIAEAHKGSITVFSEINKGSDFQLTIPIKN
jgi:signal transduction histidine kinase